MDRNFSFNRVIKADVVDSWQRNF